MNVDFTVTLPKWTILQGVVQLSSDDSLTPIAYYSEDRQRNKAEWEIKVAMMPGDEIYLRYLLATFGTPDEIPLVIQGIAGVNQAHSERLEIPIHWKSLTIRISSFSSELTASWFSISIFDSIAELPDAVANYFRFLDNFERPHADVAFGASEYDENQLDVPDSPSTEYTMDETGGFDNSDYADNEFIAVSPSLPSMSDTYFPVWYATNRQGIHDKEGKLVGFSAKPATTTTYGKCLVDIPESHVIGETRAGFWQRAWLTVTFRKDESALRLLEIQPATSATAYWTEIQHAATKWPSNQRCGLVFIHGYNVSFEEAALRAAQIGADLQVRGPVGFFSWPSRGTLLGYAADEAAIEASEEQITQYLLDFARESQTERIHIIAHSMGNRGLLRALQRIGATAEVTAPKLFEQIILAAPDVDKALFLSLAEHYHRLARHTTLYVSNKDLALASSRMLRIGMDRAGLTPPVTIAPNIDTVNVTNIDMTLLGHGYVAEARDVLADMHQLLYQNAPPDERMGLRSAEEAGQRYWIIGA